ncbi:hypothetical protein MMC13_002682 [Lambiella insularis]|nr:hypothetical protein [Lambiella insularis]
MVRIRKVKCDEGRPACCRCISSGRVCDGYGIWGGGGNLFSQRQRLSSANRNLVVPRPPVSPPIIATTIEENRYFEWFTCRTATKLPGTFVSSFWNTLLFQASLNEPAVLHAVLALSSVHKRGAINTDGQDPADIPSDEQGHFTLQQYSKAIRYLQPHFSAKSMASFRVALITCVVFICSDFLRGHFQRAQILLRNGLRILEDMEIACDGGDGILCSKPCREPTDGWIVETFSRLCFQVELFQHAYQHPCLVLQVASTGIAALVFHSINEAWQQMARLLNMIFHLTHQGRQQADCEYISLSHFHALLEHQQRILRNLARWQHTYEAFKQSQQGHRSAEEETCYQLLTVYHTMADIMAATCISTSDESAFDSHTNSFVLLIKQSVILRTIASATSTVRALPGLLTDMSHSVIDMGWIPPLYFAAVKCRVHRIRLQAIRLLESTSHREGIWDAKTAARVARKVMEIEEQDFYKDILVDGADDFPLCSSPHPQHLLLSNLPETFRIRQIEVVLSGNPMDRIFLFCKREEAGMDCRVLLSEYDVHLRRWKDGTCG